MTFSEEFINWKPVTNERCFFLLKFKLISMKVTITKQQILQNVSWGAGTVICTKSKAKHSAKNDEIVSSDTEATNRPWPGPVLESPSLKAVFWPMGKLQEQKISTNCIIRVECYTGFSFYSNGEVQQSMTKGKKTTGPKYISASIILWRRVITCNML